MDESTHHIEKIFQDVNTKDPKIKIINNIIYLLPFYWNYAFITTFLPIPGAIYILTQQDNLYINIICSLIILGSLIMIANQLRYYNSIIIDDLDKNIRIKPNMIFKPFLQEKKIKFEDVKKIDVISNIWSDGFWLSNRRYILLLILKNNQNIRLISAKEYAVVKQIEKNLEKLIM